MAFGYASKWRQWVAAATVALMAGAATGQGTSAPWPKDGAAPGQGFDWLAHTETTLDTLKGLLHLDAGQVAAWDAWSEGVLKDAHRELDHKPSPREMPPANGATAFGESTPEQMARGIAHLRKHLARMQAHLLELEAAQARTQVYYDTLDVKQKTVFDLYWHEVRHRISGDDGEDDMHGPMGAHDGMGASMRGGEHPDPGAMMRPRAPSSGAEHAP